MAAVDFRFFETTKILILRMDVVNGKTYVETYKQVKTMLVSQPKPERSPYYDLEKKYELQIDWIPFVQVEPLTAKEFRKQRIRPDEFSSIIFTSKNSIDHFFALCEEMTPSYASTATHLDRGADGER